MIPIIFPLISASSEVKSVLGTNPIRFYPFGRAPQQTAKSYGVWQLVGGQPVDNIDCIPDADTFNVQIDLYSLDADEARDAAEAVRNAIQKDAKITAWRGESREPSTELYRYSFDALFYTKR